MGSNPLYEKTNTKEATMKRITGVLLVLTMAFSLTACGGQSADTATNGDATNSANGTVPSTNDTATTKTSSDELVFGVTYQNMQNEVVKEFQKTLYALIEEYPNVTLLEGDGEGQAEKQVSQVENFIAQGVDAVILQPFDNDGCAPAVDKCNEAGIPCFVLCTMVSNQNEAVAWVGSNDVDAGEMAAEYILSLVQEGDVAVIQGPLGHSAEINRTQGIHNGLEGTELAIVLENTANWDRAEGMNLTESWLQTNPDLVAILAENDEMALGAAKAVEAQGKEGIYIIGIDAIPDAVNAVKSGTMCATLLQDFDSQTRGLWKVMMDYFDGKPIEKETFIPFVLITPENADEYL